jgi:SP family sugar:H+ symporter-like MFS transporter
MVIMVSSPNARKGTLVTNIMRSVWIVTAETPTLQLREKTITIATFSGFTIGILVTFINPYMQDEGYGNLQGKVGFVYGAFSVVAAIWVAFVLPEMRGRALEELDEMFGQRVSTFKFGTFETEGLGAEFVGVHRGGGADDSESSVKVMPIVNPKSVGK